MALCDLAPAKPSRWIGFYSQLSSSLSPMLSPVCAPQTPIHCALQLPPTEVLKSTTLSPSALQTCRSFFLEHSPALLCLANLTLSFLSLS